MIRQAVAHFVQPSRRLSAPVHSFDVAPFPISNLRQVFAVLVDVFLVLDELVPHHLFQVGTLGTQVRQAINHVFHQVEPIQVVLHSHVKGCRDGALFLIAPDVEIAVGATVGQPVDQPWISMKTKDDVFIFSEK